MRIQKNLIVSFLIFIVACSESKDQEIAVDNKKNSTAVTEVTKTGENISYEEKEIKVIIENEYKFMVREFDPHYEVKLENNPPKVTLGKTFIFSPIEMAISFISSQVFENYDWYYNLISNADRKKLDNKFNDNQNQKIEFVKEKGKKFIGKKVVLTHLVERSPHSLIHYKIVDGNDEKNMLTDSVLIKRDGIEGFRIVQEVETPVFRNWNFEGKEKTIKEGK